jgi:hypothetical protein
VVAVVPNGCGVPAELEVVIELFRGGFRFGLFVTVPVPDRGIGNGPNENLVVTVELGIPNLIGFDLNRIFVLGFVCFSHSVNLVITFPEPDCTVNVRFCSCEPLFTEKT